MRYLIILLLPLLLGLTDRDGYTDWTKDSSCVGAWRFNNDLHDTAIDTSGNNNHGANSGADYITTVQWKDGAYWFFNRADNTDIMILGTASSINNLTTFSIVFWGKFDNIPYGGANYSYPLCQRDNAQFRWICFLDGDNASKFRVLVNTDTVDADSIVDTVMDNLSTHHIAVTYDNAGDRKVRIYVDGNEASYDTQTAGTGTIITDTSVPVSIGNRAVSLNRAYDGRIDEVAIFSRILTAPEIREIYNFGIK